MQDLATKLNPTLLILLIYFMVAINEELLIKHIEIHSKKLSYSIPRILDVWFSKLTFTKFLNHIFLFTMIN